MEIGLRNSQKKIKANLSWLKGWAKEVLSILELSDAELSILLVSDHHMKELNQNYRGISQPTDVLSFSMNEGEFKNLHPQLLGDIVISLETASQQARERGHSLEQEVCLLLAHGILHLLGYDHEESPEKRKEMETKVRELLEAMKHKSERHETGNPING